MEEDGAPETVGLLGQTSPKESQREEKKKEQGGVCRVGDPGMVEDKGKNKDGIPGGFSQNCRSFPEK
jgi:hypothetical protein